MVYEFRKAEMDCSGDVYTIDVDNTTYLLVFSSIPVLKDNKLCWVLYLTDKKGNVLCDASVSFGLGRFNNITEELLGLLADGAKGKIGVDFSDTFMDILARNMERRINARGCSGSVSTMSLHGRVLPSWGLDIVGPSLRLR